MIQILLKSINSEDNIDSEALDIENGDTFTIPEGMFLQMGYSVEDGDELEEGSYELKENVIRKFFKNI